MNAVSEKACNSMKQYSELYRNIQRMAEKIIPPILLGLKSNRLTWIPITKQVVLINQDAVLNSAAARLGQSLRETEDELYRDMLAGTATVINCVNGTNGGIAVLKSDLIDLELSSCNDGDNRAQAFEGMVA